MCEASPPEANRTLAAERPILGSGLEYGSNELPPRTPRTAQVTSKDQRSIHPPNPPPLWPRSIASSASLRVFAWEGFETDAAGRVLLSQFWRAGLSPVSPARRCRRQMRTSLTEPAESSSRWRAASVRGWRGSWPAVRVVVRAGRPGSVSIGPARSGSEQPAEADEPTGYWMPAARPHSTHAGLTSTRSWTCSRSCRGAGPAPAPPAAAPCPATEPDPEPDEARLVPTCRSARTPSRSGSRACAAPGRSAARPPR